MPLSDIAVNPYTVSELVRLCLRKEDAGEGSSDMNGDEELEVVSVYGGWGLGMQVFMSVSMY